VLRYLTWRIGGIFSHGTPSRSHLVHNDELHGHERQEERHHHAQAHVDGLWAATSTENAVAVVRTTGTASLRDEK